MASSRSLLVGFRKRAVGPCALPIRIVVSSRRRCGPKTVWAAACSSRFFSASSTPSATEVTSSVNESSAAVISSVAACSKSGDVPEAVAELLVVARRGRRQIREASERRAAQEAAKAAVLLSDDDDAWRRTPRLRGPDAAMRRQQEAELVGVIGELKQALRKTGASPSFARLVETSMDPCWDWATNTKRPQTDSVVLRTLDALERRLLLFAQSERHADTRFGSLRMDLGSSESFTEGRTSGSASTSFAPVGSRAKQDTEDISQRRFVDRQYLSHDASISGRTVSERASNARQKQLERGMSAATDYRARKRGGAIDDSEGTDDIAQQVEDKIQISKAKGDFDNLEGSGKPLKRLQEATNPFLDSSERVGFDLLQKHGFAPEWIELQKEIRSMHEQAQRDLAAHWLGCNEEPSHAWLAHKEKFIGIIAEMNRKVRHHNLVCPATSQLGKFVALEEVRRVRRGAREILGRLSSRAALGSAAKAAPAPTTPRRLMTPFRDVFGSKRGEVVSRVPPRGAGQSIWSRVAEAFSFKR